MTIRPLAVPAALVLVTLVTGCDAPDKVKERTNVCLSADEIMFRVPKNAKLAPDVDYAEMVRQQVELDKDHPERAFAVKLYSVFSLGTKCKGAKDEAKCLSALTLAPQRLQGIWQGPLAGNVPGALMIRVTKHDEVTTVLHPDEAKSVFLPVDTAEEAAAVAAGKATATMPVERTLKCDVPVERRADGGYVVTGEAERCEGTDKVKFEQRVLVTPKGTTSILGEKKIGVVAPGTCTAGAADAGAAPPKK